MHFSKKPLNEVRIIGALNGIELYGSERKNIEVLSLLKESGAAVKVGINEKAKGGDVERLLQKHALDTFYLPFGAQWSKQWLKKEPLILFSQIKEMIGCSKEFSRQVESFSATHIHIGNYLSYSYLFPSIHLSGLPLIYRMGDAPPVDSMFNMKIWRSAARRASRIVANSDYIKNSILRQGLRSEKVLRIYNSFQSEYPEKETDSFDAGDSLKVIYLGQVAAHKGVDYIVRALSILKAKGLKLNLEIVGSSIYDGNYRREVEALIERFSLQDFVSFFGWTSTPSLHFKNATFHVAPSIWEEPLANVVLEAKRAGVPSIVFPSGGLPEMISHLEDGYICTEKTVESLAEAMEWMALDKIRCRKMGEVARINCEKKFNYSKYVSDWIHVYRS